MFRNRWYLAGLLLVVFGLIAGLVLTRSPAEQDPLPPEVVASVNGEVITRSELWRVQTDLGDLQAQLSNADVDAELLEKRALQSLIQRQLLLQEAARRNISVTDPDFDSALTELRSRFPDLASLGVWMSERGLDDGSLIKTIREDLLVKRVAVALAQDVAVAEAEIQEYFEAHDKNVAIGEELRLRIIAVNSREAAEQILNALSVGEDFSQLARQLSLGSRAAAGGDTGWVDSQSLPPDVRQAVANMQEDEATGPVVINPDEFLVIGLLGRRDRLASSLEDARAAIEQHLLTSKQQRALPQWLAEQEATSSIRSSK